MKVDRFTKVILCIIAALFFLNFVHNFFASRPVLAVAENGDVGRYQISSWAAHSEGSMHHNAYYVLDTLTGKIMDKQSEVHGRTK